MATVSNLNPKNLPEDIASPSSNPEAGPGSPTPTSTGRRRKRKSPDELAVQEADVLMKAWSSSSLKKERKALTPTRRKRIKIKEEEEDATKLEGFCGDDDSVGSRLAKLAEIVRILEKFDLSLRTEEASGSHDEQRLCHLIYSHVNSYIFLYHLQNKIDDHPSDEEGTLELPFEEEKVEVLIDARDLQQTMWEVVEGDLVFHSQLLTCRSSFRSAEVENTQALRFFGESDTSDAHRLRKQQLLDVLNTLEVIGEWRDYSPPSLGEEVQLYWTIRRCINSSLACITAKTFVQGFTRKRSWRTLPENHHENIPIESEDLFFFFPGHRLALVFDLIPEYRALLQECKHRVSQIFSSCPQDAAKGVSINISEDDKSISQKQLIRWEPKRTEAGEQLGSSITTRLDCLKLIAARIKGLGSFGDEPPTQREVRLCIRIAEHIRSSLLLFHNKSSITAEADKPSHQVDIGDVEDYSGLSSAQGDGTRGQVLERIMSFLKAFRSPCLAEMPTLEEVRVYRELWRMFRPSLMACLGSEIPQADDVSEAVIAAAKHNLLFVYKSLVGFFGELRSEYRRILGIVHGATLSAEGLSLKEALSWFYTEGAKKVENKLREFFGKPVPGRIDQLDQTIQILDEVHLLGLGIFYRLGQAITYVDAGWQDDKFGMVSDEVNNALKVIRSEKVFGI